MASKMKGVTVHMDNINIENAVGRPRAEIAPETFAEQVRAFRAGEITADAAAKACGISRMTFFRRLKEDKTPVNLGEILQSDPESRVDTEELRRIPVQDLRPDPKNFYTMAGIEELASNIELIGLQQPLRVRPEADHWTVVSGHRRLEAIKLIRKEKPEAFAEGVPCLVDAAEESPEMRELRLIYANSSTRVMTPSEKSKQAERVTELLYQLKEQGIEFPGRMREHVAQACQVSSSKIARLHAIRSNLGEKLLELFDKGEICEGAAYELQKLPADVQAYLGEQKKIQNNGILTDNAERLVQYAEIYRHPKCKCPDGSDCGHTLARFKQTATADMSWRRCGGGCCLDCSHSLNDCPYQCPQAKAKREAEKAGKKEAEARAEEAEKARRETQRQRAAGEYAEVLKLAEAAGLPDDTKLRLAHCYSVGDLRKCAQGEGFYDWVLTERLHPTEGLSATDLFVTAETLGVRPEVLMGRAPMEDQEEDEDPEDFEDEEEDEDEVFTLDTSTPAVIEPAWLTGDPTRPGRYLCQVDMGAGGDHEATCEYRDGVWYAYGAKLYDGMSVTAWWPLPEKRRA